MQLFKPDTLFDFMSRRVLFLVISLSVIFTSYSLLFTKGMQYGIDFSGGTVVQVKFDREAPIEEVRALVTKDELFAKANITEFGSIEEIIIKIPTSTNTVGTDIGDKANVLLSSLEGYEIRRVDMVGPKVGNELREKGLLALFLALLAILIYISFRFEWRFAIAAIFALVHDVSIAVGAIVFFNIDVNLDILAAILTILGYSLNDTIIVFDRIREGLNDSKSNHLPTVINESISKTLSRTTLTSLTTFFVVLTLFLFGGEILNGFSLTLMVGVIVGTYSSIFVAASLLVWLGFDIKSWRLKEAQKLKKKKEKERIRAMYERGTV